MSKMIIVEGNSNDKDNVRVIMVKGEKGEMGDLNHNDIVNNLTSTATNKVLSANQGRILKGLINTNTNDISENTSKIEEETSERTTICNNLQSQIISLSNGSPLTASSTSEMIDTTRTYVNTTDGNWYYYNGTEWVVGGVYQAQRISNDSITYNMLDENLKNNFSDRILENVSIDWQTATGYLDKINVLYPLSGMYKAEFDVVEGEIYYYSCKAYYNMAQYLILDSNNNVLDYADGGSAEFKRKKIVIPENGVKMILQKYYYPYNALTKVIGIELDNIPTHNIANNSIPLDKLDNLTFNLINGLTYNYENVDVQTGKIEKKYVFYNQYENYKVADIDNTSYWYNVIPVNKGETYIFSGTHDYNGSGYILVDENNICLRNDGYSNSASTEFTKKIYIQDNEKYLIIGGYNFHYLRKITSYVLKDNKLSNKKMVYDGDSICESRLGQANNGGAYAKIISDMTNSTYANQAVSGGIITSASSIGSSAHSVVDNLTNLPTDGDLYCFEGGINDYWSNCDLGTYNSTNYTGTLDIGTFCGALETIFRYSLNNFVGKPIVFVIVHKIQTTFITQNSKGDTFNDYYNAIVGICKKYSIPYYDAYNKSGLNGWNTVQSNNFLTAGASGQPDGTHPNENGYKKYYVPQLINLFNSLLL